MKTLARFVRVLFSAGVPSEKHRLCRCFRNDTQDCLLFKFSRDSGEQLTDRQMLGTDSFTLAAFNAVGRLSVFRHRSFVIEIDVPVFFDLGALDARGMDTEYYGFFYNRVFEERANHDISLALSSPDELKGLMPTDIITTGQDNQKPEAERYYELLQTAGVETTYRCFENSRHGFLVNLYDEWQEGEDYVSSLVLKHLAAHNG